MFFNPIDVCGSVPLCIILKDCRKESKNKKGTTPVKLLQHSLFLVQYYSIFPRLSFLLIRRF
jgi:hypothetical protein